MCKDVTERSSSIRNNFYAVKFLYRINSFTEANYSITLSVLSPRISIFPVLNTGRRFSRAFFIDCRLCLSNYIRSSGQLYLLLRHSKRFKKKEIQHTTDAFVVHCDQQLCFARSHPHVTFTQVYHSITTTHWISFGGAVTRPGTLTSGPTVNNHTRGVVCATQLLACC